ncbi:unnamed protein product [Ectocarpus sp. 13 AM-2016]
MGSVCPTRAAAPFLLLNRGICQTKLTKIKRHGIVFDSPLEGKEEKEHMGRWERPRRSARHSLRLHPPLPIDNTQVSFVLVRLSRTPFAIKQKKQNARGQPTAIQDPGGGGEHAIQFKSDLRTPVTSTTTTSPTTMKRTPTQVEPAHEGRSPIKKSKPPVTQPTPSPTRKNKACSYTRGHSATRTNESLGVRR